MKRFVKVWGNRCNLDATEQLVKAITTSCACVGVDDKITVFVTESGLEDKIKELFDVELTKGEVATMETEIELSDGKGDKVDE